MYRRFVEAGISEIDAAFIESKRQSRLCLGSDAFQDKVIAMYGELVERVDARRCFLSS